MFIYLSLLFFLFLFLLIFFFRDPKREIGDGIISPADGKVMEANKKISIFMNLWDVHVNRAPLDGEIKKMEHFPGKHAPAFMEKENERLVTLLSTEIGIIKIVQIAGIFARRIVPYVKEGDVVKKGDKIGIVRFGSKVEIYLPDNVNVIIKKGDKVKAGQTIGIL
ncbi:MAG: phosphatidylserine decarboxylase family protein [Thermoplasmata archaeon]|nr:MAG: phosphatidylserine decarboxylase family protein [Thermoplasmata archaeon]